MKQTIDRRAVLDCIGFDLEGRGELAVRFAKASFDAGGKHIDEGFRTPAKQVNVHRFTLSPGADIDAAIDIITPHLAEMGYDPPSEADVAKLKALAAICWTPGAIEAHLAVARALTAPPSPRGLALVSVVEPVKEEVH